MISKLRRAELLNTVLAKLGARRALEASETHATPIPNPHGLVGVDFTHGKYRARIRFCDALSGEDVRITLVRTDCPDEAQYAYRAAHVALWGSASWACDDNLLALLGR
jgi:hypothetical protein